MVDGKRRLQGYIPKGFRRFIGGGEAWTWTKIEAGFGPLGEAVEHDARSSRDVTVPARTHLYSKCTTKFQYGPVGRAVDQPPIGGAERAGLGLGPKKTAQTGQWEHLLAS